MSIRDVPGPSLALTLSSLVQTKEWKPREVHLLPKVTQPVRSRVQWDAGL